MTEAVEVKAKFPKAYRELFQPKRWKVYYGGRDAAKSWNFARALLLQAAELPLRVLCCREVMKTLSDSVHQLLTDQIAALGLQDTFKILDTEIIGIGDRNQGAWFKYAGLRSMDAHKVKSFEGIDVAWVEEAQTVSEKSWLTLENTIRSNDSEIWVSFNPDLDSDPTYKRFVVNRQPESVVKKVTWLDNPFYSKVLELGREKLRETDPIAYDNVWEGNPRSVVEGAIYAREVTEMVESRRITRVPYDPKLPVHTIWDLGWNDQTSIIFAQKVISEVRIIDYEEESFLRFDEWAKRLKEKPYNYGEHYLPHDGANSLQAAGGLSAQKILKPLLRQQPKIIPRPASVEIPIRAARMLFPRMYVDEAKCARLMDCLKRFRRGVPEATGEPGAPVKDEYRHGADAFGGLALIVDKITNDGVVVPLVPTFEPSDAAMGL